MENKTNQDNKNYKKINPICRNNSHMCRCNCHNKIRNNNKDNQLLLLEENYSNFNCDNSSKLHVIKTETNNNLIKSFVIYKNQIKPLYISKITKNSGNKSSSNIKKYSYGGNKLRISTITNNHSYKEIFGRSSSKDKMFKESRVINYISENNNDYNFYYGSNNNKKQNNLNIIKDIKINKERVKNCSNKIKPNFKTNEIDNFQREKKYDEFINNLKDNLKNNIEKGNYLIKNEAETIVNNQYISNNLTNKNKNFRYYFDYKKNLIEKKNNLLKSNSNTYININKNNQGKRINDKYEDIKLKIKLGLMKKNQNNNEKNKDRMDIDYIILEKTKKILEEKNKKLDNKLNKKYKNNEKENNTLGKLKNFLEKNNINNYNNFLKEKN